MLGLRARLQSAWLFWSFIRSLLLGSPLRVPAVNPNAARSIRGRGWQPESVAALIEEGRRQLDHQTDRMQHVTDRAQVLLGIALVVVAFGADTLNVVSDDQGRSEQASTGLWALGFLAALVAALAAGSIIVVKAMFGQTDTTMISHWDEPVLEQLADDYADTVIDGENVVAARVLMLRKSTRVTLFAGGLLALARVAALL